MEYPAIPAFADHRVSLEEYDVVKEQKRTWNGCGSDELHHGGTHVLIVWNTAATWWEGRRIGLPHGRM